MRGEVGVMEKQGEHQLIGCRNQNNNNNNNGNNNPGINK